jgi:hypothetical protein
MNLFGRVVEAIDLTDHTGPRADKLRPVQMPQVATIEMEEHRRLEEIEADRTFYVTDMGDVVPGNGLPVAPRSAVHAVPMDDDVCAAVASQAGREKEKRRRAQNADDDNAEPVFDAATPAHHRGFARNAEVEARRAER